MTDGVAPNAMSVGALATSAAGSHTSKYCRNCDAYLGNTPVKFCPQCGQDTANHPPTFWEFVHEFITHYVALEGKLWKTLLLLFFKPAELTREYRAGRKLRYISPLRLYITASFLFFLVVKIAGWGNLVNAGDGAANKAEVAAKMEVAKGEIATALAEAHREISAATDKTDAEKAELKLKLERAESMMGLLAKKSAGTLDIKKELTEKTAHDGSKNAMAHFDCAPDETACLWFKSRVLSKWEGRSQADILREFNAGAMANVPYALFLLLPLFALLTKIIYINRGLYFGEHVVYALHVHAFTFFAMLLMALLPSAVQPVIAIAAMLYYLVAMQRFFGGRWWATLIRYSVVAIVYQFLLATVAAFVLLFVIVS